MQKTLSSRHFRSDSKIHMLQHTGEVSPTCVHVAPVFICMQCGSSVDSPSLYSGSASWNLGTALQRGTRQDGGLAHKALQVGTTRKGLGWSME